MAIISAVKIVEHNNSCEMTDAGLKVNFEGQEFILPKKLVRGFNGKEFRTKSEIRTAITIKLGFNIAKRL